MVSFVGEGKKEKEKKKKATLLSAFFFAKNLGFTLVERKSKKKLKQILLQRHKYPTRLSAIDDVHLPFHLHSACSPHCHVAGHEGYLRGSPR